MKNSIVYQIVALITLIIAVLTLCFIYVSNKSINNYARKEQLRVTQATEAEIKTHFKQESMRLKELTILLQGNHEIAQAILYNVKHDHDVTPIKKIMDPLYQQLGVDVFQVSDDKQRVIYRAHKPSVQWRNDAPEIQGVLDALGGQHIFGISKGRRTWVMRSIVPCFHQKKVIGTIMVGIDINNKFINKIAPLEEISIDLSIGTSRNIIASSLPQNQMGDHNLELLAQSIRTASTIVENNPKRSKVIHYFPIELIDKAFGMAISVDTGSTDQLLVESRELIVKWVLFIAAAAIFLGILFTVWLLNPLKKLKKRADEIVYSLSGEKTDNQKGNEISKLYASVNIMTKTSQEYIKRLEQTKMELLKSEAYGQIVMQSSGEAMRVIDTDFNVIQKNTEMEGITGQFQKNQKCFDLFSSTEFCHTSNCTLQQILNGVDRIKAEVVKTTADGKRKHVEMIATPLIQEGKITGIIESFRDITVKIRARKNTLKAKEEAKSAFEKIKMQVMELSRSRKITLSMMEDSEIARTDLMEANKKVLSAAAAKSEFLANMSHEIRTPLNGVTGMLDLLTSTEMSTEQLDYATSAKISADTLLVLINDILDFSKIEAGKLELEEIDFNLRVSLESLSDVMAIKAYEKGVEFFCLIQEDVPTDLMGDPGRLRQIVTNLCGNAIKFIQEGEILINVALKEIIDSKAILLFKVSDTGIGIPKDKVNRLFKSFSQVDSSTTRKYGGTGLGLAISKQLVELMGGEIGVYSEEGKGSTFWFTSVFKIQKENRKKSITLGNIENTKILIVDDNTTNRIIFSQYLKAWGCISKEAASGKDALSLLMDAASKGKPFVAVIIDMQMPCMNGEELCKIIMKNPAINKVALIMVTSSGQRGDVARLKEFGLAGYLTKPIKKARLFDCLRTIFSPDLLSSSDHQVITKYSIPEHTVPEKLRPLRILLAEDNKMNQKIAAVMLKKAGHTTVIVSNGLEAVGAFKREQFDLILMDGQMPVMDGIECTKEIRRIENTNTVKITHIPIIAITADAMKGDRERFIDAGMDDYISKPLKQSDLIKTIARCIRSN